MPRELEIYRKLRKIGGILFTLKLEARKTMPTRCTEGVATLLDVGIDCNDIYSHLRLPDGKICKVSARYIPLNIVWEALCEMEKEGIGCFPSGGFKGWF